jgi:hypothetical protein
MKKTYRVAFIFIYFPGKKFIKAHQKPHNPLQTANMPRSFAARDFSILTAFLSFKLLLEEKRLFMASMGRSCIFRKIIHTYNVIIIFGFVQAPADQGFHYILISSKQK